MVQNGPKSSFGIAAAPHGIAAAPQQQHFILKKRMDQSRVSDFDTAMLAKTAFDKILEQIQVSNLNFQLRLSPFSASISLKKSFIRDKSGYITLPTTGPMPAYTTTTSENDELVEKNEQLNLKIVEMQNFIESKSETIQTLTEKISNVEASAHKSFKEKNDEVNTVKNSLKNANQEIAILKN